jgi:hypothetical protein
MSDASASPGERLKLINPPTDEAIAITAAA